MLFIFDVFYYFHLNISEILNIYRSVTLILYILYLCLLCHLEINVSNPSALTNGKSKANIINLLNTMEHSLLSLQIVFRHYHYNQYRNFLSRIHFFKKCLSVCRLSPPRFSYFYTTLILSYNWALFVVPSKTFQMSEALRETWQNFQAIWSFTYHKALIFWAFQTSD